MDLGTILWILLGIALVVAAGRIRRGLPKRRPGTRPGLSPVQELQGAPPGLGAEPESHPDERERETRDRPPS